ncbi:hypothetical protein MBLNU230_g0102t1 [Neophaeotheca triangularis]
MDQQDGEPHANDETKQSSADTFPTLENLVRRAETLLSELEAFKQYLQRVRQQTTVEIATFRGNVQSELAMLKRLAQKPDTSNTAITHVTRSSNLPFLETVWTSAKRSRNLIALQKRIHFGGGSDEERLSQGMRSLELVGRRARIKGAKAKGVKQESVVVDSIGDGGRYWVKVSLLNNVRLLFDLAKLGWHSGDEDSEDDDQATGSFGDSKVEDDDNEIPLLKTAKELVKAASACRIRTTNPVVHFILPRIQPGKTPQIDKTLDRCRSMGVVLHCGPDLDPSIPSIYEAQSSMVPDPMTIFTPTLNVDCTILLALVSEFSHARVSKEPWFHRSLQRQVEIEDNENLLPSLLYPALGSHALVTTKEAAVRMREIVDTIGTASERARTAIMMGDDDTKSREQLIEEMQSWSAYPVPSDWQLPLRIVDQCAADSGSSIIPAQASKLKEQMTDINVSVFFHGWANNRTTITSNRTVVKQIETFLETFDDLDESAWPSIWLCPTARSLVGKEKRGEKKGTGAERKEQSEVQPVYRLPDPLERDLHRRNGLDVLSQREGRPVEDMRPRGYPSEEVTAAKNASIR